MHVDVELSRVYPDLQAVQLNVDESHMSQLLSLHSMHLLPQLRVYPELQTSHLSDPADVHDWQFGAQPLHLCSDESKVYPGLQDVHSKVVESHSKQRSLLHSVHLLSQVRVYPGLHTSH